MIINLTRQVNATPDAVFDALADVRNEVKWNALVTRADLSSPEPIGMGTTFDTVTRGRSFTSTISIYERPTRLAFEVTNAQLDFSSVFAFEAANAFGPTTLSSQLEFRPKGWFRLIFPLVKSTIARGMPKRMASFGRFVESTMR